MYEVFVKELTKQRALLCYCQSIAVCSSSHQFCELDYFVAQSMLVFRYSVGAVWLLNVSCYSKNFWRITEFNIFTYAVLDSLIISRWEKVITIHFKVPAQFSHTVSYHVWELQYSCTALVYIRVCNTDLHIICNKCTISHEYSMINSFTVSH
jgi:hypothetical protein